MNNRGFFPSLSPASLSRVLRGDTDATTEEASAPDNDDDSASDASACGVGEDYGAAGGQQQPGTPQSGGTEVQEGPRCTGCWEIYSHDAWYKMSDSIGICGGDGHQAVCEPCVRSRCMPAYWGQRENVDGCCPTTIPWPRPGLVQTTITDYFETA